MGSFQYAAATGDADLLRRLTDHAITRHHPAAAQAERPALALLEAVVEAQASLIAQWMDVGFVHGVMNTDNMTISGETIDYGPCAFMDAYDPATVYSSIDHGGRYAYGRQPRGRAVEPGAVRREPAVADRRRRRHAPCSSPPTPSRRSASATRGTARPACTPSSGSTGEHPELVEDLLTLMAAQHPDHTRFFRALSSAARGDDAPVRDLVIDREAVDAWLERWHAALAARHPARRGDRRRHGPRQPGLHPAQPPGRGGARRGRRRRPRAVPPAGRVLADPFTERPGQEAYAAPDPAGSAAYVTYCGT